MFRTIEMEMGGFSMSAMGSPTAGSFRSFSDFAILYRLQVQGEIIGRFLKERGVPYQRLREAHWTDCPEIRQTLSRMKTMRPFTGTPLQALEQVWKDPAPLPESFQLALRQNLRPPDQESLKKFRLAAAAFPGDLDSFLEIFSLQTGLDTYQPDRETVKLLTLHGAKGLEFPVIIICGCEAGLLPLTLFGESDPEEERRLFYVGCTRASEKLFLTRAQKRFLLGQSLQQSPSPFLADIDEKILSRLRPDLQKKASPRKNRQMSLFK